MTVKQIFDLAINIGVKNDFRTKQEINDFLRRKKEKYQKLSSKEKSFFDKGELVNPYADSQIHFDGGAKKIKKALAGVDITMGGVMLAKELGVDLIINHHPVGRALARLDDVMDLQVEMMEKFGVPVNIAEKTLNKKVSEVARGVKPNNHYETVDAARLMKVNLINIHTPADNCVAQFTTKKIGQAKPRYVSEAIKTLLEVEEYQEAARRGFGPVLFAGEEKNRCGRVVVSEMTGGTEGSPEIYQAMANAGIGTVVAMHQSERHREAAESAHVNVIIAGHISSDSIGMNLVLDELEKRGMEIVPFSGLIRVSRNKKK